MDDRARQLVRERANSRCEYYRLPQQVGAAIRFHVEHIRPRQHGGGDDLDNLALACPNCNWNKGPNLTAIDADTGVLVPHFNPRSDRWKEHFAVVGAELIGLTDVGRATARLLQMNSADGVEVRREILARGEFDLND
jgi:HNH endonuclease